MLEASQDALPLIDQILMEYHSVKQQNLYYLSEILKQQGYTLSYAQDGKELTKFNIKQSKGLISVHAWRQ